MTVLRGIWIALVALAPVVAHSQVTIDPPPKYDEPPRPAFKMTPKEVAAFVKESRQALLDQLKDPDSARIRGLFLSQGRSVDDGKVSFPIYLCGELNAKNGYGGYVGFRRFAGDKNGAVIEKDDDHNIFAEVIWSGRCTNKVRDVK